MNEVTLFENIKTKTGGQDYDIKNVFTWITEGTWKNKVEPIRLLKNKDEKSNAKKDIPYFTASGTFSTRSATGLTKHSGVIAIDFDELEDPEEAKSWLAADRFSWFTCLSVGGAGLVVFVKIQPDKHLEAFNFLQEYYQQNYGLTIDKACKDIPRARIVTYDPNSVFNPGAEQLIIEEEAKFDAEKCISQIEARILAAQPGERHDNLLKQSILVGGYVAGNLLDEIEVSERIERAFLCTPVAEGYNYKKTITDGINNGKSKPITIDLYKAAALRNSKLNKNIKELMYLIREQHRNGVYFDVEELDTLCKRFDINYADGEKVVNKIYKDEKNYFAFNKKAAAIKAQILIGDKYDFRNNIVKQNIDFRIKGDKDWAPVRYEDVWLYVQERTSSKVSIDNIKNLLKSNWVEAYDPFAEYFENLKKWDGKTDYIAQLARSIKTNDDEYFEIMFKKHLVRAVGCSLAKKINRYVLVIVGGRQNTGKSTFIRFLNPFKNAAYYSEVKLKGDKDTLFAMSENFIYNMEELDEMSKYDVNHIKSLISQWSINERRPYAHSAVTVFRRCSFFASTNNSQFLTDTENTRWLCIEINDIDWSYSKININNIWAQAYALYHSGFNAELTKEEGEKQEKTNKSYEVSDNGKDLIAKYFKVSKVKGGNNKFYSITDLTEVLLNMTDGKFKMDHKTVGRSLKQLGFEADRRYINGSQVRGYWAEQVKGEYSNDNQVQSGMNF